MFETITVHSSAELYEAIKTLSVGSGGEIQVTASSDPYVLSAYKLGNFAHDIKITAADAGNPPNFGSVKLVGTHNITFEGLVFDNTAVGAAESGRDFEIQNSDNVRFLNNTFIGTATEFYSGAEGQASGGTLGSVREANGFAFEGNTVSSFLQGLALRDSTDITVAYNSFTELTGDGLRMSGIQNTLIEGNNFSDFYGSEHGINHDDMIQVWSAPYNKLVTKDLIIRDNFLNASEGAATQTIFIRNEMQAQGGPAYENIVVENNLIYNGHVHGITIDGKQQCPD